MKRNLQCAIAICLIGGGATAQESGVQTYDFSDVKTTPKLSFNNVVSQNAGGADASVGGRQSTEEVAKSLSNPNSPLAQLTFTQAHTQFKGDLPGADDQTSNITQFQPGFPFPLDNGANFFVRPLFTYVWKMPVFDEETETWSSAQGWGDIGYDIAYGRSFESGWTVIGGLQGTIPTDTDVSGGQWRIGPEFIAGYAKDQWFGYFFPAHQWDIGGDDYEYSTTSIEVIAGVHLPNSWVLQTDSTATYDHVSSEWTVPINATIKKVTKWGNTPVQISLGVDYYVDQPDAFGQDWAIKLKITPVVPNFIYNWIKG